MGPSMWKSLLSLLWRDKLKLLVWAGVFLGLAFVKTFFSSQPVLYIFLSFLLYLLPVLLIFWASGRAVFCEQTNWAFAPAVCLVLLVTRMSVAGAHFGAVWLEKRSEMKDRPLLQSF